MKILITPDWYAPAVNGVVTSVMNLRKGLMAQGHDVRILTLSQSPHSFVRDGVTYIDSVNAGKVYPGARLRTSPAEELIRDIAQWHPDVVHSQCEFSTFFIAKKIAAALDIPLIHTYHTVYENYTHYFSPSVRLGRRGAAVFSRWTANCADSVIVPTEKVRDLLLGYGVRKPIDVIPTGLDLAKFGELPESLIAEMRRNLGIPDGGTVLVSVGRLAEEKNTAELIRELAALGDTSVTLLLVGDGPCRAALQNMAKSLGVERQVIFTGMISPENIPLYYRLGDLFVSASSSETQGLTYIEALASGVPLLCRRDKCLRGVVRDGVNGWQYDSPNDFSSILRWYMSNGEHIKMSENAVSSVNSFSSSAFAARVAAVYREEITRRSSRGTVLRVTA